MNNLCNPYALPTLYFVGGETQELAFHVYSYIKNRPFSLSGCVGKFAIVSFTNKTGAPILTTTMQVASTQEVSGEEGIIDNIFTLKLYPGNTAELHGKYIYQISIKDIDGDVEIPKQGIMYITNNIHKSFII